MTLIISSHSLESVSIDFIMGLPMSERCNWIPMVVDRYSKYANFIPTLGEFFVEQATRFLSKCVLKDWGFPNFIGSYQDTHFTGCF